MVADTYFYDLLSVSPDASDAELKKAYRKASLVNHPDKNPGDGEASARFQEISAAYEVLSEPKRRKEYDDFGPEEPSLGGGRGGSMGAADMDDIFTTMFGAGMGMGGGPRRKPQKGENSVIDYDVSLKDLYLGRTAHFNVLRQVLCLTCSGSGGKPGTLPKQCVKCQGKGRCLRMRSMCNGMVAQSLVVCDECQGEGEKVRDKDKCKKCKGTKKIKERKKLELRIERGMVDGQTIVFKGQNDQEPGVSEAGDIVFRLKIADDSPFELKGLDLVTSVHLNLRESLMGFEKRTVLVHLDGRHIQIAKQGGKVTRPGSIDRIVGAGMPRERDIGERGDLYIRYEVFFPQDGWLQGREEAQRALSSVLPPPRQGIQALEGGDVEVIDAVDFVEAGVKRDDIGRNQPKRRQQDGDFWQEETEAPAGGCAGQ